MFPSPIFDNGLFRDAKLAMEANQRTQAEVAHNLNNYDTPGFRPRHTDFHALLNELQADPPKGEAFQAYLEEVSPPEPLNVEQELARLSQCSMEHDAFTRILNKQYSNLRSAIYEGKR